MEVIIRQAKENEASVLAGIEAAGFPPAEAASPEDVAARLQVFPENFLVAEADGKAAGFINGGTTDKPYLPDELYHNASLHCPDGAWQTVFGLSVLPEFRKRGIAGALLERFVSLAQERGREGVILTCKEHMIRYYEKHGFVKYGKADSCHGGAVWYEMRCVFS